MSEPVVAIVVAAGSGVRLGGSVPKALVALNRRPLVSHAVEALAAGGVQRVVVVIAEDLRAAFAAALAQAPIPVDLVTGGQRRQDSVRCGLEHLAMASPSPSIVLVHDAARPLVPAEVTARVIAAVEAGDQAVVPVIPVVDSIRQLSDHLTGADAIDGQWQTAGDSGVSSVAIDRSRLRAVQTPQGFDFDCLLAAHRLAATSAAELTDDAAAVERAGQRVRLVAGSRDGLKVTEPIDLLIAGWVLAQRGTTPDPSPTLPATAEPAPKS